MAEYNLIQEKQVLIDAIREAGQAVHQLQQSKLTITSKANNDIVTEADICADAILKRCLLGAFANDGWLSEETVDDAARLTRKRVWIVDPIDGTREYAAGMPEYALSVALVEDGVPILASVYNPAVNELFYAIKDQGAWLNDTAISTRAGISEQAIHPAEKLRLLASRSEYKRGEWAPFEAACEVVPIGSIAYKLALVAAGRAHATFSLGPKSEWDIAAGVLLVLEAGGAVFDKTKQSFIFNNQKIRVNGIVASADSVSDKIFSLISSSFQ